MRIMLMKTTFIRAEWGSVMFVLLSFGALACMSGCGNDSEPRVTVPVCDVPPSELEGTSCDNEYDECRTTEESHPCCLGYICACLGPGAGPNQRLQWGCVHAGCADSAMECPEVCEVDSSAAFCPRPWDQP